MKFTKVRDVKSPVRGTAKSAGIDFFVPNEKKEGYNILPHSDVLIPSGIKANIPEGYMLMAAEKSGVVTSLTAVVGAGRKPKDSTLSGVVILGAKIVDEDYQGEIHIHLVNVSGHAIRIPAGMKIAQFILVPVSYDILEEVSESELFSETTERGDKGFGLGTGNE